MHIIPHSAPHYYDVFQILMIAAGVLPRFARPSSGAIFRQVQALPLTGVFAFKPESRAGLIKKPIDFVTVLDRRKFGKLFVK
jgi:hypothetical protein